VFVAELVVAWTGMRNLPAPSLIPEVPPGNNADGHNRAFITTGMGFNYLWGPFTLFQKL
jgi:hypothetical protein